MEFEEFDALVQEARGGRAGQSLPEGFELFDSLRVSESDLRRVEETLEVELPDKYKQFMLRYGGGVFMFLELLPAIAEDGYAEDLLSVTRSGFMDPGLLRLLLLVQETGGGSLSLMASVVTLCTSGSTMSGRLKPLRMTFSILSPEGG